MLIKVLSFLAILGLVSSLSMAVLYQSTNSDLKLLQEQHTKLQSDYDSCVEDKKNFVQSTVVTETVVAEKEQKVTEKKETLVKDVEAIASYPKKCIPSKEGEKKDETNYVDIDEPFDPEFLRVYEGNH